MRLPWYLAALGAALVWGFHYPLVDFALKRISLISVLLISSVPIIAVAIFFYRDIVADYHALQRMTSGERALILAVGLTSLIASAFVFMAIRDKNATLASLIEISYPVFVALFAYLLFRQVDLSLPVVIGALLSFAGIGIIIWSNP
jgi:drug/metabolite transporter (DMT)-like permease